MQRTFLIWLSAVICITFLITGALVYSQFSRSARENAEQMMSTRLNDMLDLFSHAESSITYLSRANDASALDRTRALAEIIHLNPSILSNQEELQGICNRLGAEQIVVSNEDGAIEASVPAVYVGSTLSSGDDTHLLTATARDTEDDTDIPDEPEETEHQGAMKFAAVHRLDKPGMVRLGFRTRFEQASREESSFDNPAVKLRLGTDGRVIVIRRGIRVSHGGPPISQPELMALPINQLCKITLNDEDYFAYAANGGGYRLIGILPAKEIYRTSLKGMQSLLLSNLMLFLTMFIVVSYLLQRIVLRGMSKVNEALRDITEGDLEKRVNVGDSPEFTRLSNGINFMVESLRSVGEERQQGIKRGLELARTLQGTMLPTKFPAFPEHNRFDLYATCYQASDVGGDFYDFSMPDARHLHFLVADVEASGIPAALYMMRAITIIRAIAKSDTDIEHIVAEANRELCEDNQTGIHMALFYGCLDIATGMLEYVSAGKLCALLQTNGEPYAPMPGLLDPLLGESAESCFHTQRLQMQPEDRLFLFTEGVLNAANTNNTPFSEGRLQKVLADRVETVTDVLQLVRNSLRKFVDGSKFKKDIAMLCMEYKGDLGNKTVVNFSSDAPQDAIDRLTQSMEELFVSPRDITDVQQSISALAAALPEYTDLRMEYSCTEQEAEICILYAPPAYDPLPMLAAPLPVDRATHEFIDNKANRLTLWKTLT